MASAEKILSSLMPDYYDQLLPFFVNDQHVKEICEYKRFENSDLTNLKIAVVGSGAIIEVANLVMGAMDQNKGKLYHSTFGIFFIFDIQSSSTKTPMHKLFSIWGLMSDAKNMCWNV